MFTRLATTCPAQCQFLPMENKLFWLPSEHGEGPTMHRLEQEAEKKKISGHFPRRLRDNICCLPEIYGAFETISHCCRTLGWDEKQRCGNKDNMGPLRIVPLHFGWITFLPLTYKWFCSAASDGLFASVRGANQQCLFVAGCLLKAQEWVNERGSDLRVTDRRAWSQELFNHQLFYLCLSPWLVVWRQSSGWNSSRPSDV